MKIHECIQLYSFNRKFNFVLPFLSVVRQRGGQIQSNTCQSCQNIGKTAQWKLKFQYQPILTFSKYFIDRLVLLHREKCIEIEQEKNCGHRWTISHCFCKFLSTRYFCYSSSLPLLDLCSFFSSYKVIINNMYPPNCIRSSIMFDITAAAYCIDYRCVFFIPCSQKLQFLCKSSQVICNQVVSSIKMSQKDPFFGPGNWPPA